MVLVELVRHHTLPGVLQQALVKMFLEHITLLEAEQEALVEFPLLVVTVEVPHRCITKAQHHLELQTLVEVVRVVLMTLQLAQVALAVQA